MKYRVSVVRYWVESGTIIVDANSKDDVNELARDMLSDGDDAIEWGEMSPEEDRVEHVEPVEE